MNEIKELVNINNNPGYIFVPYMMVESTPIICPSSVTNKMILNRYSNKTNKKNYKKMNITK